jgi:CubicO group peptidase (beta-lactamase class C family)
LGCLPSPEVQPNDPEFDDRGGLHAWGVHIHPEGSRPGEAAENAVHEPPLTHPKDGVADAVERQQMFAVDVFGREQLAASCAALAVVQDGKVALVKAYGQRDVEANLPVAPTTQFVIGSITKSFTATGVALLHNEGRLDWIKPVREYIPEFRLHDPVATERVSVRDLLC